MFVQILLLCMLRNTNIEMIYFDSFGVAHVNEEIKKIIGNKNIKTKNI